MNNEDIAAQFELVKIFADTPSTGVEEFIKEHGNAILKALRGTWRESSKERPPRDGTEILGYWIDSPKKIHLARYMSDRRWWTRGADQDFDPHYWIPIPKLPKEG